MRAIADEIGCSVGTVHRVLSEPAKQPVRQLRRTRDTARLLETIERGGETAANASRHLEVELIEPAAAAEAADLLDEVLLELRSLRRRLRNRAAKAC